MEKEVLENSKAKDLLAIEEKVTQFQRIAKKGAFKAYHLEYRHKYLMSAAGVVLFPILNVLVAHSGIVKLGEIFNFNFYFNYLLSFLVPAVLEIMQYNNLKPLSKLIVNDKDYTFKDVSDVVIFTLLIMCATTFGMYTIANNNNSLFEYRFLIAFSISSLFTYLTVYSNLSLERYYYKSLLENELKDPDYMNADNAAEIESDYIYRRGIAKITPQRLITQNIRMRPVALEIQNQNNEVIIDGQRPTITGFNKQSVSDTDSVNNAVRYNAEKRIVGQTYNCRYCGKAYVATKPDNWFCKGGNCRIAWHKKNDGFDLELHQKAKKGGKK